MKNLLKSHLKVHYRELLIIIVSFILVFVPDFFFKRLALQTFQQSSEVIPITIFGPLSFTLTQNMAFIVGSFHDFAPEIRILIPCTFFAFLCLFTIFFQMSYWGTHMGVRWGQLVFFLGIAGNVLDKIIFGYTVDYLWINGAFFDRFIFNLSDVFQWVGCLLMVIFFLRDNEKFWPLSNLRAGKMVNAKGQAQFTLKFIFTGIFFSVLLSFFSISYIKILTSSIQLNEQQISFILNSYTQGLFYVILSGHIVITIVALQLSHRYFGPLKGLKRFIENLKEGKVDKTFHLQLRRNDQLSELVELADYIKLNFTPNAPNTPKDDQK